MRRWLWVLGIWGCSEGALNDAPRSGSRDMFMTDAQADGAAQDFGVLPDAGDAWLVDAAVDGSTGEPPPIELATVTFTDVEPILTRACVGCHSAALPESGLDLQTDPYMALLQVPARQAPIALVKPGDYQHSYLWHKIEGTQTIVQGVGAQMPVGAPLDASDRELIALWIDQGALPPIGQPTAERGTLRPMNGDPGHVIAQRLTLPRYDRAVQALLQTGAHPSRDFPAEERPERGFRNDAQHLTVSPALLTAMQAAAERLVAEALQPGDAPPIGDAPLDLELDGPALEGVDWGAGESDGETTRRIAIVYQAEADVAFPAAGTYTFRWRAMNNRNAGDAAVQLLVDGESRAVREMPPGWGNWTEASAEIEIEPGVRRVALAYPERERGRETPDDFVFVDWLRVQGPAEGIQAPPPVADGVIRCDEETPACARQTVVRFARLAWRGQVSTADIDALMILFEDARAAGDDWRTALAVPLVAVLLAPDFVFQLVDRRSAFGADAAVYLSGEAMAARLAAFLWGSLPDHALLDQANDLQDPRMLGIIVDAMLDDPRAQALVEDFFLEWTGTDHQHDARQGVYAERLDPALTAAAHGELLALGDAVLFEGEPLSALMLDERVWVNDRLAAHYGMPAVDSDDLIERPADDADGPRMGLLGKAGFYVALSGAGERHWPRIGNTILTRFLCRQPPPPPMDVGFPPVDPEDRQTPRERFEITTGAAACAGCHREINAVAFSLEGFDPIGAWTATYHDGLPIDSSTVLPDGTALDGPADLAEYIAGDPFFGRCAAEHLLAFALGRATQATDLPHLKRIATAPDLRAMVHAVVQSPPFRQQSPRRLEAP